MGRAVTRHIVRALCPEASTKAAGRRKWTGLWPLDRLASCQGFAGVTAYPGELPTGTDELPDPLARPYLDMEAVAAAQAAKTASDTALEAWKDEGLGTETYQLEKRYNELAAGVYADSEPAANEVGSLVVGLIVVGIIFGIAAIAFSVAAYQYCANLRDQTALAGKELDERVQAARDGVVIPTQPLTTPPSAPMPGGGGVSAAMVVGGVGLLAAAGGAAWWALRLR